MSRFSLGVGLLAVAAGVLAATPAALNERLAAYRASGAGEPSTNRGAELWTRRVPSPEGAPRSCASCHGTDPRQPGRHATTGKAIEPLASSAQSDRFSDPEKVEKWFKRNCTWTWGRECTAQEKGDFLAYLSRL